MNTDEMRKLALNLEQTYGLPQRTFAISDAGELTTFFPLSLRGEGSKNIFDVTSGYTVQQKSLTVIPIRWDRMNAEVYILASLYWDHFAHVLGLKRVIFKLSVISKHYDFSQYKSILLSLGYLPTSNAVFQKKVDLNTFDTLMKGKRDFNQSLIDVFLSDQTFTYTLLGFGTRFSSHIYYMGQEFHIVFNFHDGHFHARSDPFKFNDKVIETSIYSFMTSLYERIYRSKRLSLLYSPSKFHFSKLFPLAVPPRIKQRLYNHLLEQFRAEEIELECAHKDPSVVITKSENIIFMRFFDRTYVYDTNEDRITYKNVVLK